MLLSAALFFLPFLPIFIITHRKKVICYSQTNTPAAFQRCVTVDIDGHLVCDLAAGVLKQDVTTVLDKISAFCGVDIFLLGPKLTPMLDGMTGDAEMRMDQRWRVAIYGVLQASEHAKARVLIHIDTLVCAIFLSSIMPV